MQDQLSPRCTFQLKEDTKHWLKYESDFLLKLKKVMFSTDMWPIYVHKTSLKGPNYFLV